MLALQLGFQGLKAGQREKYREKEQEETEQATEAAWRGGVRRCGEESSKRVRWGEGDLIWKREA